MNKFNKNQSGQAALEAAIILIAFVVVASVFAFAVLSAGTASTEKGEQAIYAGLQGVQSSMEIKGAVIAEASDITATTGAVDDVVFTVSLVAGGDPINLAPSAETGGAATPDPNNAVVVIAYRDSTQAVNSVPFAVDWIVGDGDDLLEDGEVAELTVYLTEGTSNLRVGRRAGRQHRLHARNQAADRLRHCHQPHHARRARIGHGTAVINHPSLR